MEKAEIVRHEQRHAEALLGWGRQSRARSGGSAGLPLAIVLNAPDNASATKNELAVERGFVHIFRSRP